MNIKVELSGGRHIVITCDKYQYITEFFGKNENKNSENYGSVVSKGKVFHPKIGQLIQSVMRHELEREDVKTLQEMNEFIQHLHDLVIEKVEA